MASEPAQATLCDLEMPHEAYYAAVITYVNNYLYRIEDFSPASDAKLWEIMSRHTVEYFQSIKIRGTAISTGQEPKRNSSMEDE